MSAKNTDANAEIQWKFKDDQGRSWRGVGVAEASREDKGQFPMTLKLACGGGASAGP